MFAASTVVTVSDGKTADFWTSSWVEGRTPKSIAPSLFHKSKRKKISVLKALQDNLWISHILPPQSALEVVEYVKLWEEIHNTRLVEGTEDSIRWRWTGWGVHDKKRLSNSV